MHLTNESYKGLLGGDQDKQVSALLCLGNGRGDKPNKCISASPTLSE